MNLNDLLILILTFVLFLGSCLLTIKICDLDKFIHYFKNYIYAINKLFIDISNKKINGTNNLKNDLDLITDRGSSLIFYSIKFLIPYLLSLLVYKVVIFEIPILILMIFCFLPYLFLFKKR